MIVLFGYIMAGGAILYYGYFAFESIFLKNQYHRRKMIEKLSDAFKSAELYTSDGKNITYPYLLNFYEDDKKSVFFLSIPKGMNPLRVNDKLYVFKQYFGEHINMIVNTSNIKLSIYDKGLPKEYAYNLKEIETDHKLPIICGRNLNKELITFDLTNNPHILIAGETGSGKSSQVRAILTTLIKNKSPDKLQLVLGDLKRSEFHLFKKIEHVKGVYHTADQLRPSLKKVKREMIKRGNKLDDQEVSSIDALEEMLPYIIVCIDEVGLLKKEKDIMDILEEISSIGRSLGVFIVLSMQRPDSKLLDGKLKVNLTVRMGFRTSDKINSNIIGTPGSETIKESGRMILQINSDMQKIQCPWLSNDDAKKILEPFKLQKGNKSAVKSKNDELRELFKNE